MLRPGLGTGAKRLEIICPYHLVSPLLISRPPRYWRWFLSESELMKIYHRNGTLLVESDHVTIREWVAAKAAAGESADLSGAVLIDANLRGADLSGAVLIGANLRGAVLSGAVLIDANLRGAVLSRAVLSGAVLIDANLSSADLSSADLSDAVLIGANLSSADLSDAVLIGANLRSANLTRANLTGAPKVDGLRARVRDLVTTDCAALSMRTWHTCATTHCLAGWAVHLADAAGAELEKQIGSNAAGALIWHASEGVVPDFYCGDEEAIEWLNNE
jgi:hypothetical protein